MRRSEGRASALSPAHHHQQKGVCRTAGELEVREHVRQPCAPTALPCETYTFARRTRGAIGLAACSGAAAAIKQLAEQQRARTHTAHERTRTQHAARGSQVSRADVCSRTSPPPHTRTGPSHSCHALSARSTLSRRPLCFAHGGPHAPLAHCPRSYTAIRVHGQRECGRGACAL
jgi:hypothetical protein